MPVLLVRRVLYRFDEHRNLSTRIVDLTAKIGMSYTQQFLECLPLQAAE
jgi:hypothetical protein